MYHPCTPSVIGAEHDVIGQSALFLWQFCFDSRIKAIVSARFIFRKSIAEKIRHEKY